MSKQNSNNGEQSSSTFSVSHSVQTVVSVAVIMATLLTLWTPFNLFASQSTDENLQSLEITSSQQELNPETPAIQLITGSLLHDRDMLESQTETVAAGITLGLLCFLSPSTSEQ